MRMGFSVSPVYFQQLTYMYSSSRRAASPSAVWYSFAEVCAARFVAVEGVDGHHSGDYQEVFRTQGLLELGVEVVGLAHHAEVGVEFLAYFLDFFEGP